MNHLIDFLASFRLRLLFRGAFLLLVVAVAAMAVAVLQGEKQRSHDSYRAGFLKTKEQIVARLRHPAGQLALLNPRWDGMDAGTVPVLLPFAAIDFDDQAKVQNAVEMAGCLVRYQGGGSLCVAIGNSAWAGGFVYAAGAYEGGELVPHRIGDEILDDASRLRVALTARGQTQRWIAPFEPLAPGGRAGEPVRGRFTGYAERPAADGPANYRGAKPVRDFRAWVWQDGRCATEERTDCARRTFFSVRLPADVLRDALFQGGKPTWPPPDLANFRLRLEVLPPGAGPALFDNAATAAATPFSLAELSSLLLPGERLVLRQAGSGREIFRSEGRDDNAEPVSPLLAALIRRLPVAGYDAPTELRDEITTPAGRYELQLTGDARSMNRALAVVASRLSWFVGAMLAAIALAWLAIEIGLVRRIATLTKRTRGLSRTVHGEGGLERYELSDLRGRDELGLLAAGLDDLLRRVREDADRERIRAAQEKDQWHAVGHEIMSPLQSLLALHGDPADPSHRYIARMQQAVRVLYGSASPGEAFEASRLTLQSLDLARFLRHVAENAGVDNVVCEGADAPLPVRADEYPLEDVFAHLLNNAARHRTPGTPIRLVLGADERTATVAVINSGPPIAEDQLERIFEYGVSDQPDAAPGNRGQGLFVARTYLAKMGGTLVARNGDGEVRFELGLLRAV